MLSIRVQLCDVTLVWQLMIGKIIFDITWLIKFSTGGERLWSNKLDDQKSPIMQGLTRGSSEGSSEEINRVKKLKGPVQQKKIMYLYLH